MKSRTLDRPLLVVAAALVTSLSFSVSSFAQQNELEEVITIGTRAQARSTTDSTAPIDLIKAEDFQNQGGIDTSNLLRNVVPSYNVNDQPISDAATLVRPANLRGLAPDHTLLLVNGKRRHRAAVITWLGNGISDGSQGPDVAAIPALALKSAEVLRDGAAAQYGSDAIAGVVNFNLNDSTEGGTVAVSYGEYTEGDGDQIAIGANKGFAIGNNGFINLTAQYSTVEATNRSIQRDDAAALIVAGYQNVENPAQVWGSPEVDDNIQLWANYGFELAAGPEFYGYVNHNSKKVIGGFYYRNPTNRSGVYGDGTNLLVGDLTPGPAGQDNSAFPALSAGDGIDCPAVLVSGGPTAVNSLPANCFSFQQLISGGFTPSFGGDVKDIGFLNGIRGETAGGLGWDFSVYYGQSIADFFINNTVNASLGPNTPRDFDPGSYEQKDLNVNADFNYLIRDDINIAFGTEYRVEEFSIVAGQTESYIDGGLGAQGFSTSTNGFPGFSPTISGDFDRSNYALYVDGEWDVNDSFILAAAVRYEDFEDFGTTTNYKVGANYKFTENFGGRATVSTGFKAPTPGQVNASNISTQFVNGQLTNQGVIPSINPIAQAVGATALQPEDSSSYTLGVFFSAGPVDFTVDYFNISVDDRLNLSSQFLITDIDPTVIAGLNAQGIDTSDIVSFSFFTNQFDTETTGFDVVATAANEWGNGALTNWSLSLNTTDTQVTRRDPALLDDTRVRLIEDGTPDTRWNLSANTSYGNFTGLVRVSYYGDFFDTEAGGVVFDDATLVDFEFGYDINETSSVSLGVRNAFDEAGCKQGDSSVSAGTCGTYGPGALGLQYSQFSPFGSNGTYYYGRYEYNFAN